MQWKYPKFYVSCIIISPQSLLLKVSLQESETRNGVQLANFQNIITHLESELQLIHANIKRKKKEYETLESEIKQYKLLLEELGRWR